MSDLNINEYNSTLEKIINHYNESINRLFNKKYHKQLIFIFDIDDTLLSTIPLSNTCIKILPPNKSIVNLYNNIRNHGIKTGIITARNAMSKYGTLKNLNEIGISQFDEFFMRESFDLSQHVSTFKYNKRKMLSNQYEIIGNIGDQETDFSYGLNGLAIKLPNLYP